MPLDKCQEHFLTSINCHHIEDEELYVIKQKENENHIPHPVTILFGDET